MKVSKHNEVAQLFASPTQILFGSKPLWVPAFMLLAACVRQGLLQAWAGRRRGNGKGQQTKGDSRTQPASTAGCMLATELLSTPRLDE